MAKRNAGRTGLKRRTTTYQRWSPTALSLMEWWKLWSIPRDAFFIAGLYDAAQLAVSLVQSPNGQVSTNTVMIGYRYFGRKNNLVNFTLQPPGLLSPFPPYQVSHFLLSLWGQSISAYEQAFKCTFSAFRSRCSMGNLDHNRLFYLLSAHVQLKAAWMCI